MGYLLATMIAVFAASPSPEEVRQVVDSELRDKAYQRALPGVESASERFRRYPLERVRRRLESSGNGERFQSPPRVSSGARMVATMTLWVIIIACAVVVLIIVIRAVAQPRRGKSDDDLSVTVHDDVIAKPLGDAQKLAQLGRYAEAIHTLLLRTLQELSRRAPEPVPDSLTSREILRRVALPDAARSALSGLIDAVEITHFGGRDPDETSYLRCLDSFNAFARSYTEAAA